MLTKRKIESKNAPKAIGPYSQALIVGDFIYISGQLGLDPKTQEFVSDDILDQAKQIIANIKALLEEAGASLDDVIKVEVFLTNMNFFPAINEYYSQVFSSDIPPVRQTVEVSALPKWAKIMMSCTAILRKPVNKPGPYFDVGNSGQKIADSYI